MPQQNIKDTYASQYFTGAQASIWIGDIWVDECFGVQFQANQSIIPIYGYASSTFDAVARGKVLVQGIFEINFIDAGYLYAILQEAAIRGGGALGSNIAGTISEPIEPNYQGLPRDLSPQEEITLLGGDPRSKQVPAFIRAIRQQKQLLEETSVGGTANPLSRRQTMSQILDVVASLDIAQIDQLARELDPPAASSENIIYKMIPFNLKGRFGSPEISEEQGTIKTITNCFLIGNEMIVSSNDEVVKERYSFIAQTHI